jgi:hypothetical protein
MTKLEISSSTSSEILHTTVSAAKYLGIEPSTLNVWRSTGRYNLEFIKVGRLVKYRQSILDAFLMNRTRTQTA